MSATTRRGFLRGVLGASAVGAGIAAAGIPAAGAQGRRPSAPDGTLVVVDLAGGLDGLSLLVPHGDPGYRSSRPTIAVGPPGERYGAIDLGRGLGLHPALAPLANHFGRGERLAIIGGIGVPDGTDGARSHRPAREFLARGGRSQAEGWIARLLRFEGLGAESVWSFGPEPHPMLEGIESVVSAPTPVVSVGPHGDPGAALQAVATGYRSDGRVGRAGLAALAASSRWSGVQWTTSAQRLERGYPAGDLGRSLAAAADMIRARRGLRIAVIEDGGYDTHVDQGDARGGVIAHKLDRLARGLGAFWRDVDLLLPAQQPDAPDDGRRSRAGGPVSVVVVSEFGRSIDENDSGGTEHGRGGVAFAAGDVVVGGIHGELPRFGSDAGSPPEWPVTTDVRRILADAVAGHGFRPWRGGIFPALPLPNRSLGLLLSP